MQELIDVIRAAIATDASKEQKAAGVQACRTIITALDTEPGKPLTLAGIAPVQATSRVSLDQVLDLMIARLSVIANERETKPALAAPPASTATTDDRSNAPRTIAAHPVSPGFRVPMAASSTLKAAARPARPIPRRKA